MIEELPVNEMTKHNMTSKFQINHEKDISEINILYNNYLQKVESIMKNKSKGVVKNENY